MKGLVWRSRPFVRGVGAAFAALAIGNAARYAFTSFVLHEPSFGAAWLAVVGLFVLLPTGLLVYTSGQAPSLATLGSIAVDDDGISLDGERVLARSHMPPGTAIELQGDRVRIHARAGIVDLETADPRALAFDLVKRFRAQLRFVIGHRGSSLVALVAFLVSVLVIGTAWSLFESTGYRAFGWMLAFLVGGLPAFLATRALARSEVAIGADGVHVRARLGRDRFVSHGDLRRVEASGSEIRLEVAGGEPLRLGTSFVGDTGHPLARASSIASLLEEARMRFLASDRAKGIATLLAPGGRTASEWREALSSLSATQASFRTAAVGDDQLWDVALDASQLPEVRIAAAVALGDRIDDEGGARLRIAADDSAAPRLRVAFEAVAARDEEALLATLGAIAEEKRAG